MALSGFSHAAPPVVLIHGLWTSPVSWESWVDRFTAAGHNVLAPAWPGVEGSVEALRRDPSAMAGVGFQSVVDHFQEFVRGLERPPILIGHSFGGTVVQVLLDRGLGAAGVAIHSAAVKGVLPLPLSTLRSTWPVLKNPANRRKAMTLTFEQFRYAFVHNLPEQQARQAYDRYHVPGSARVLFQGAFANFAGNAPTRINPRNSDRAPLLLIAGSADHIVPPAVNKANARLYRKSTAVTDYHEFPGRSHFTVGQDGWEDVADFALSWATSHTAP
ncbi:alpha/beta hydrolase [Streptomyces sp. NPDC087659]|uniref:alpha/beta hydrolase n=1 Tax=Streptomyces sp. NPDC087659 TaxID=3365801 RepID=UPI003801EA3F